MKLLAALLAVTLAGCAGQFSDQVWNCRQSLQPWGDVVMKDDDSRAADPRFFGIAAIWIGLKCRY